MLLMKPAAGQKGTEVDYSRGVTRVKTLAAENSKDNAPGRRESPSDRSPRTRTRQAA